jgi:hypothetical protein
MSKTPILNIMEDVTNVKLGVFLRYVHWARCVQDDS